MAGKDSSWLRVEVCRQFARDKCTRSDSECKYAHPSPTIDSSGGAVTACFDYLRKRCRRESCRYYHPPDHIVTQLVTTGGSFQSSGAISSDSVWSTTLAEGSAMGRQDKSDRLEVCREHLRKACSRADDQCRFAHPPEHITVDLRDHTVTVCMDFMKGRCSRDKCRYFHPLPHLQNRVKQQQAPGTTSMLMEQILVSSQRKRPSSTPADVLANDYRRSTMPYPGAAAAAANAAAVNAAAVNAAYAPAAAAAYDPSLAYAHSNQQQVMSESPFHHSLYVAPPLPHFSHSIPPGRHVPRSPTTFMSAIGGDMRGPHPVAPQFQWPVAHVAPPVPVTNLPGSSQDPPLAELESLSLVTTGVEGGDEATSDSVATGGAVNGVEPAVASEAAVPEAEVPEAAVPEAAVPEAAARGPSPGTGPGDENADPEAAAVHVEANGGPAHPYNMQPESVLGPQPVIPVFYHNGMLYAAPQPMFGVGGGNPPLMPYAPRFPIPGHPHFMNMSGGPHAFHPSHQMPVAKGERYFTHPPHRPVQFAKY